MAESDEDLKKQVEQLKSELEAERARGRQDVRLQVSAKGGVSLYGIRRFPITFYVEEWLRILDMEDEIRRFLAEHESELVRKKR